jgi:enoyl-CoA hydratase/carnithine racemase
MEAEVLFTNIDKPNGTIGHILLNRPNALNALSLNMLQLLRDQLEKWQHDDSIKAVLIEGTGDRAFCAGGDIRAVYHNRERVLSGELPYFQIEYHLNELIFNYNKPYIAILDGVAMGGGLGISIWGSHPIATERLMFAMPETGIGLFPDIGASYFLTRLPNYVGYYLGLTGNSINAYEALQLGLVKTVINHEAITSFKQTLDPLQISLPEPITLDTKSELLENQTNIANCFNKPTMTEILAALDNNNDWCQKAATLIRSRSPLSLKVTFELLKKSHNKSFKEIMQINAHIVQQFLNTDEFFEGIRAAVIDKDKSPIWQHPIDQVDAIDVTNFFIN